MFPAAKPYTRVAGLYGFGLGSPPAGAAHEFWKKRFNFNIVDKVMVPKDLPEGEYLLSHRWDCEVSGTFFPRSFDSSPNHPRVLPPHQQTPQIWTNCADVTIGAVA